MKIHKKNNADVFKPQYKKKNINRNINTQRESKRVLVNVYANDLWYMQINKISFA